VGEKGAALGGKHMVEREGATSAHIGPEMSRNYETLGRSLREDKAKTNSLT
jgi:hypothetical protein